MRKLYFLLAVVALVSGCEKPTSVELGKDRSLVFFVSGSGRLSKLVVYGPEQEQLGDPEDSTYALWEIVASEGDGPRVSELHSISYGVVPAGYKQVIPRDDKPPAGLMENRRYFYRLITMNAPHASGYFEVKDGRPTKVKGPCFELRNGSWNRIECPDSGM